MQQCDHNQGYQFQTVCCSEAKGAYGDLYDTEQLTIEGKVTLASFGRCYSAP